MRHVIGILGGTFDPVHYGHLRCALEVQQDCGLEQVRFMPCGQPPHRRPPAADAARRLAMLEAATCDHPGFRVDTRELRRDGPSYTVDTLLSLREELPDAPLCLLLGMDAFLGLPSWSRWERLIELAHLIVMCRPGADPALAAAPLRELLQARRVESPRELRQQPAGAILLQPVTQLDISASRIRDLIARGRSVRYLLPDRVLDHIRRERLYLDIPMGETELA
jgi:nicotinate-nucleotide adenylyltransferase